MPTRCAVYAVSLALSAKINSWNFIEDDPRCQDADQPPYSALVANTSPPTQPPDAAAAESQHQQPIVDPNTNSTFTTRIGVLTQKPRIKACREVSKFDCDLKFTNQKSLDNHMRDVHKIKAYPCPNGDCRYRTARSDNIAGHQKHCKFRPGLKKRHRGSSVPPSSSIAQQKRPRRNIKDLGSDGPRQHTQSAGASPLPDTSIGTSTELASPSSSQDGYLNLQLLNITPDLPFITDGPIPINPNNQHVLEPGSLRSTPAEVEIARLNAIIGQLTEERNTAQLECSVWKEKALSLMQQMTP
ncbi:hypothetical protein TWF730_002540 [Orbilia blumenaviensis]|uniref:C2H2-type domain-containing protein n=1 Tax=Orbilia blumenaviensis TaxID=1796055 RepID=A0AAV9UBT5_9PEZI